MSSLSIIRPLTITDAMLVDCDVPENDYGEWSGATTYALGSRVILADLHKVYESLQAGNLNHSPDTSPTWWALVGATNRWRAFDQSTSTPTVTAGGATPAITYVIEPGTSINAVGLVDVREGAAAQITLEDPTYGVVYDETLTFTLAPDTVGWWDWFFGDRRRKSQQVALGLPAYPQAQLTIAMSGTAALSVGAIIVGQSKTIGIGVRYGARVGILDYSRREVNEFGDVTLVPRLYAKRANLDLILAPHEVDVLQALLADLRTTACLWIASSDYDSLVIYGWYKVFEITIAYSTISECSLEIWGLT